MGLKLVAPLREGAPDPCLQAPMNDHAAIGREARIDAGRQRLTCRVPFGTLTGALHDGFAGVLRPCAACATLEASAVGRQRRRRGRRARTLGSGT